MSNPQTSQGQTLQKAKEGGRDPSSSTQWGQPGFKAPTEPQSFKWDGNIGSAPEWIDKGWAGYDAGPALNVPKGDPNKGPYTTQVARIGDTITYTPGKNGMFGGFAVARAEETGQQPGMEPQISETGTTTFRPAANTEATLESLVETGLVSPEDMDPEARAQFYARQASGDRALSAEAAGHIPSQEGVAGQPPQDGPQARLGGSQGQGRQRDPNVGPPPEGDLPEPQRPPQASQMPAPDQLRREEQERQDQQQKDRDRQERRDQDRRPR